MPLASLSFAESLPGTATAVDVVNKTRVPKRVVLKQKTGGSDLSISFPFGPTEVSFNNFGLSYSQVNRPDLKPMLVSSGPELRTMSFEVLLADRESAAKESVQGLASTIEIMASEDVDCEFIYGLVAIDFPVRITRSELTTVQHDDDGRPLKIRLSLQLTESVAIPNYAVPLAVVGGNADPTRSTPSSGSGSSGPGAPDDPVPGDFPEACFAPNSPKCGTRQRGLVS